MITGLAVNSGNLATFNSVKGFSTIFFAGLSEPEPPGFPPKYPGEIVLEVIPQRINDNMSILNIPSFCIG